jgi:predicted nucleic acid-binding protein
MIVLDTNVLSELMKAAPGVLQSRPETLRISRAVAGR